MEACMSADRRGFLRQLASLPLVGGGVALIGQPSAVAEPVTEDLLYAYESWLSYEHDRICEEHYGHSLARDAVRQRWFIGPAYDWHRGPLGRPYHQWNSPTAGSRAALVLSTVGCDWRDQRLDQGGSA